MVNIKVSEDMDECRYLWEKLWPKTCLFDLWEVRSVFANSYDRATRFHFAEKNGKAEGLLALSWVHEAQSYNHFPGETWKNKTWLEQNRLIATSPEMADDIISSVSGRVTVSYLRNDSALPGASVMVPDEINYRFHPHQYGFSFDNYMQAFPGKLRRKLNSEIKGLESKGVTYRYDEIWDVGQLYEMNKSAFGGYSYFSEPKFLKGFERLIAWLYDRKILKVITVLIGGEVAAVDVGALWDNSCTMLAGGTNAKFPGVAKLINFHHMQIACSMKLDHIDFLCGDFGWKEKFRLQPYQLYELTFENYGADSQTEQYKGRIARAS